MHEISDLREKTAKAIRYLNVALECKRLSLKRRLGMMKSCQDDPLWLPIWSGPLDL